MSTVIVCRHTPFVIVILAHQRIVDVDPRTMFWFRHFLFATILLPPSCFCL
jgi:hypothetical protein